MSDAEVDEIISQLPQKPCFGIAELNEIFSHQRVAEEIKSTVGAAKRLPQYDYNVYLKASLAKDEARPEIEERHRQESEARAKEKEQSKPT